MTGEKFLFLCFMKVGGMCQVIKKLFRDRCLFHFDYLAYNKYSMLHFRT